MEKTWQVKYFNGTEHMTASELLAHFLNRKDVLPGEVQVINYDERLHCITAIVYMATT